MYCCHVPKAADLNKTEASTQFGGSETKARRGVPPISLLVRVEL